jgi:type IX secretion system PorP/SprF family membrane protein
MKKIIYFLSLWILIFTCKLNAQDIHFSQVNETPLFLSPANTGFFNGYVRVVANYRNQWAAMNNAFQTYALSVDGGLFKSKRRKAFMGLGFTLFTDQAGAAKIRKTTALINISGLVKLDRNSSLSGGIAAGAAATNANYDNLSFASQFEGNNYDPSLSSGEKVVYRQFTTTDVAAGLAYEYNTSKADQDHDDIKAYRIAFGAFHLNRPEQNFGAGSSYKMPIRFAYSFTSNLDLEDTKFSITPTLIFQTQGKFNQLLGGTYLKYRTNTGTKTTGQRTQNGIGIGLFYRVNDALIPKFMFESGDFAMGVSYDVNLSGYRTASNYRGGFEVSIRYNNLASSLFAARKEFR